MGNGYIEEVDFYSVSRSSSFDNNPVSLAVRSKGVAGLDLPLSGQYLSQTEQPGTVRLGLLAASKPGNSPLLRSWRHTFDFIRQKPESLLAYETRQREGLFDNSQEFEGAIYPIEKRRILSIECDKNLNFDSWQGTFSRSTINAETEGESTTYTSLSQVPNLRLSQIRALMRNRSKLLFVIEEDFDIPSDIKEGFSGSDNDKVITASKSVDCGALAAALISGGSPNAADPETGMTPLHWAAYHASHEMHAMLTGIDCDLDSVLRYAVPKEILAESGIDAVVSNWKNIISAVNPLARDKEGRLPSACVRAIDHTSGDYSMKNKIVLWHKIMKSEAACAKNEGLEYFDILKIPDDLSPG